MAKWFKCTAYDDNAVYPGQNTKESGELYRGVPGGFRKSQMSFSCLLRLGIVNELTGLRVVLVNVVISNWPLTNAAQVAKMTMSNIVRPE